MFCNAKAGIWQTTFLLCWMVPGYTLLVGQCWQRKLVSLKGKTHLTLSVCFLFLCIKAVAICFKTAVHFKFQVFVLFFRLPEPPSLHPFEVLASANQSCLLRTRCTGSSWFFLQSTKILIQPVRTYSSEI